MAVSWTSPIPSQLQECVVNVSDIQWDVKRQTLNIGSRTIVLTTTEFRLLFPLRHGIAVTYTDLAWLAYNYVVDEKVRKMMDKHIDRIRSKLRGSGIYVYCVLGYGYLLLPEVASEEAVPAVSIQQSSSML